MTVDAGASVQLMLAELELPAQPLGGSLPTGLSPTGVERYAQALFDLRTVRPDFTGEAPLLEDRTILLFIRPLGQLRRAAGGVLSFRIDMAAPAAAQALSPEGVTVSLTLPAPAALDCTSIMVMLRSTEPQAAVTDAAGNLHPLATLALTRALTVADGRTAILLSELACTVTTGEIWVDISMLTLPPSAGEVDFSDLCIPLAEPTLASPGTFSVGEAVMPATLRNLPEAQARILPIGVRLGSHDGLAIGTSLG